ncbi:MAG: A/G-specific adenine glycosylase, partial [Myxococcota bacterium]|nr:A/G-specific adenine glycosylase [Myxococcota bacterium]
MHPLSRDLLAWYDAHRRILPWRDDGAGPYRTWISEVMLQQTRVETVKPYFARWMERFPTVEDLAAAPQDEVLAMWSGLGYYSRARNIHRAAQMVVEAGTFPTDLASVRALPGVGEYIAGAIASIALGLDEPAVDGNLERVLSRVHAHRGGRRAITAIARTLLPSGRAGDWNQALMDVGSGFCIPKAPRCPDCPLQRHCIAYARGTPTA